MKENDSENKINFKSYDNVKRPEKAKSRVGYIGVPQGVKMNDHSETRNTYVKHEVGKRQKWGPRKDVVGLPDGRIESESESKTIYKGHLSQGKPLRHQRKEDHLVPAKDKKIDDNTLNRQTYRQHSLERPERIRRGNENLFLPKDSLETQTVNRDIYKTHDIKRPAMVRRNSDMISKFKGEFQADSESKVNFKGYTDLGRPERYREASDHLSSSNGPLDDRTEAKDSYYSKEIPRFERIRRANDTMKMPDGHIEQITEMRNQYLQYSGDSTRPSKPERTRYDRDSISSEKDGAKLNGKSEMQERFSAKYGRRSEQIRPSENLSIQRSKSMSSLSSITSHDYRGGFESKRPEKVIFYSY